MFKKLVLIAALVLLTFSNSGAQVNLAKTYVLTNDTAVETTTNVSVTTIVPNQARILSFTVACSRKMNFSPYAALFDEKSTTTHSLDNLIGESEAAANESRDKVFPYPKNLSNGLTIRMGPYTVCIVEYVK